MNETVYKILEQYEKQALIKMLIAFREKWTIEGVTVKDCIDDMDAIIKVIEDE